jgi:hypothetical protein
MSLPITNYLELDRRMQSNGRCRRLVEKCQFASKSFSTWSEFEEAVAIK